MRALGFILAPFALVLCAQGCFAGSDCATRAICEDSDGAGSDGADPGDGSPLADMSIDSFVRPDGPLPDGLCNGGGEDCTNGMDDNCDGKTDCADPLCGGAGYTCADVPNGWTGPLAWWEASSGTAPGCGGAYNGSAIDSMAQMNAPAATCSMCSCTNATGQSCTANIDVYGDGASCAAFCQSIQVTDSGCTNYGACGNIMVGQSAKYPTVTPGGGSCTASGGAPTLPPITWGAVSRTCAYSAQQGGGCTNAICVAASSAPFGGPCVKQSGDVMCPATYPTKHLYYTGVMEGRSCAGCTCDPPGGGTCNNIVQYWQGANCSQGPVTNGIPANVCASTYTINAVGVSVKGGLSVIVAGTCTHKGGQPQGAATPNGPLTVCCR